MGKHKLFVSSTSDLAAERDQIRALLEGGPFEPYLYEYDDGLKEGSPRDYLLREIRGSKLFVYLLGRRYGSPYNAPDTPQELRDPSIVEWEHHQAKKRLRDVSIRGFDKSYPEGVEIEPEQEELKRRLGDLHRGSWLHSFDDENKLLRDRVTRYLFWWLNSPARRLRHQNLGLSILIVALATLAAISQYPGLTGGFWLPAFVGKPVVTILATGASAWAAWQLLAHYRGR